MLLVYLSNLCLFYSVGNFYFSFWWYSFFSLILVCICSKLRPKSSRSLFLLLVLPYSICGRISESIYQQHSQPASQSQLLIYFAGKRLFGRTHYYLRRIPNKAKQSDRCVHQLLFRIPFVSVLLPLELSFCW